MAVQNRNTDALAGDHRLLSQLYLAILAGAKHTKGLLLTLLLFAADVGNDIAYHLRPVLKGLARSGNRLVCGSDYLIGLKLFPCLQSRGIGLNGAVRLYSDKASLSTETLLLLLDNLRVIGVDLRDNHRNVRSPAVRAVVGDNRGLGLCVSFLDGTNLVLGHIYGAEYEIYAGSYLLDLVDIHNNDVLHCLRHRRIHFPAISHRVLVSLACASRAGCNGYNLKPGMILQQGNKSLSYHSGTAKDTDFKLLTHFSYSPLF